MKTENITKAALTAEMLLHELRAAHRDAIESGNQFAETYVRGLIGNAQSLSYEILKASDMAKG